MPVYEYECSECGAVQTRLRTVGDRYNAPLCHSQAMTKLISRTFGYVQGDICYDSPIDGRPITSLQKRLDDLARNNCVEYDPGMRQDHERRVAEDEKRLDSAVDETVERSIAEMPLRKREQLHTELLTTTVEPLRLTGNPNG